jgi:hypothetical protein
VVDSITYVGTALQSIDLRFEQHCEGGASALRGKIHWYSRRSAFRIQRRHEPEGALNLLAVRCGYL